jgi:hypothetical protein
MLNLMKSEPEVFGNQFSQFGFVPDPNDDFPVGLKRGSVDPTKVLLICSACHVAKLPDGRVWIGAPNANLDLGRFTLEVNKRWVAAGNPSLIDTVSATKDGELGPGRTPAEQSESDPLIPDDVPAAYNMSKRTWLSKMGNVRDARSEVYLSLFEFGLGYPDSQHAMVPFPSDSDLAPFVEFFTTWDPPTAPPGDANLIAQGKAVYENAKCDSCHHLGALDQQGITTLDMASDGKDRLPGDDPNYPRGSVHTSGLQFADLMGVPLPGADGGAPDGGSAADAGGGGLSVGNGFGPVLQFIAKHELNVGSSDGYSVPDLRALWASAPYLHNASVATLDDLLKPSSERATSFVHDGFTIDTTLERNGNFGHEFGTTLSASDRAALVAYLNSL